MSENNFKEKMNEIEKKIEPLVEKAKVNINKAAEKIVAFTAQDELKPHIDGINEKCENIVKEIEKCQVSEKTKEELEPQLKDIIRNFSLNLIGVFGHKELEKEMERVRVEFFGKNSKLSLIVRSIGTFEKEDRKEIGRIVNITKGQIEEIFNSTYEVIKVYQEKINIEKETIDVTLPGKKQTVGSIHPLNKIFYELCEVFIGMGFEIKEGPEVELDEYNFDKLNLPKDHPARDMQDTFYISDDVVLRTHTSPVQIRTMLSEKPPIRILSPGRVYRSDDIDATHSPIFHQMEGLVVDKNITMAHLKGVLDTFASKFFGEEIKVRLRPSYFPFTEPSAEVDLTCVACKGKGCSVCKHTGWIEVLGCGMVHPNVLRNCGIDPEEYSGFAFGMGLDRIANLKYKNNDIRLLYENDARFLRQF